jgi:myo-inositol-1(or 4)-monophosphatase
MAAKSHLHSALLNAMINAAHKAGGNLKRDFAALEHLQISLKGPGDYVSAADKDAEEILRDELARAQPEYGFIGEESGVREGSDGAHRWIVDPLDGTLNFLHRIPHFAISIALEREGSIVAGVVYNPATDELFAAERGKGAFLNDQPLRVASANRLVDAVVACALPHHSNGGVELTRSENLAVQDKVAGLRRFGTAALDLAWVAAGRFDAYWQRNLSPWDMAAGIALVREAGGFVTDLDGRDEMLKTGSIIVGNVDVHRELLQVLLSATSPHTQDLLD